MKKCFFILFLFAGCKGNTEKDSYFKIDQLQIVPCNIVDRPHNRLYLYDTAFSPGKDSIRFVFSVTGLQFVDKNGGEFNDILPTAGNLGVYEQLRSIKVFARNDTMPQYRDVTGELVFDTGTSEKPLFFLNPSDSVTVSKVYNDQLELDGAKIFPDFDAFIKKINEGATAVSHRDLTRSDSKPYIVFTVPRSVITYGKNEILVTLYVGSDTVSAEVGIKVNE